MGLSNSSMISKVDDFRASKLQIVFRVIVSLLLHSLPIICDCQHSLTGVRTARTSVIA